MKNKLFLVIFIVLLVTSAALPSKAAAHHYVYLPEDTERSYGAKNDVVVWWWIGSLVLWWTDPAMGTSAQDAVWNWTTKIPQLPFSPCMECGEDADLKFKYEPCPDFPNVRGCLDVTSTGREWRPTEKAWYTTQATVYVRPDSMHTLQSRTAVTAHELGHFYGLNEQYLPLPDCNPDVRTIMDLTQIDPQNPNQLIHCDGLQGPSDLDVTRVKAYWSGGDVLRGDLPITGYGQGSTGTFIWHDMAWAERYHLAKWYYKDANNQWIYVSQYQYPYDVGMHMYAEDRALVGIFYRTQWGTPVGKYRACTWAWFERFGQFGNGRCSNEVQLN